MKINEKQNQEIKKSLEKRSLLRFYRNTKIIKYILILHILNQNYKIINEHKNICKMIVNKKRIKNFEKSSNKV